ncbi:MAG TPA: T9SS type A sorting domain-containing protein [Ignavibacteriaceae bacterium]|nr:T9SS type A sorting domain-containing protein [Ignavibacteriaceae bacterium]
MLKKLFTISFVLVFLFGNTMFSQQSINSQEISSTLANVKVEPVIPVTEATWDVEFDYDATAVTGAAGNAGAIYIPTLGKFWTTRWASNVAHQWNPDGTLDMQFTLPFTGTRGMVFDGQFIYCSINTAAVQIVDPATKTLVGTIPVNAAPNGARFIAYNPDGDGGAGSIIVGNWTSPNYNFYEFSMSGTLLRTINSTVTGVYGLAYDKWSAGGPFLWVWSQGSGAGTPQNIMQMNYTTGAYTGIQHDVKTDVGLGNADAIAGGLFITPNLVSGKAILGGLLQGVPDKLFGYEIALTGPPCPVQKPENPTPANNAVDIPLTGVTLSWSNGGPGTVPPTQVEVFFGPAGNMTSVYSGAPITQWAIPNPLNYFSKYEWKVINKIDTCNISSSTWTFKTVQDPNLHEFCETFEDLSNWTIVGPMGMTQWNANPSSSAGGTAPELRLNWTPSFTGKSLIRSNTIPVNLSNNYLTSFSFRFYFRWYANPSGTATVSITYDGGVTEEVLYQVVDPTGNVGPMLVEGTFTTPATGSENAQIQIWYDGYTLNIWEIYWDDLCIGQVIPVELTSFTAIGSTNQVELNWTTATETNNQGFEVQRNTDGEFHTIAFVQGQGTSTEIHNYSFIDKDLKAGHYSYRLRQIDLDGTFEYSSTIEVEILGLREFALGQNYPNPFNPSTTINFSLAVDSKVSLKVFNVLGQEVASLVNGQMSAGSQKISFDASSLNSGVYFYRLDADGIDGQKFSSTKKMILTK